MGVFSNLKQRNHVARNGFDLSRRSVFSIKNGQILPVFCQYTLPNSDYRINVNQLLRTQPLQTAAFTGFSVNYDFAFVPFNQLYSSFNQFIGQREDKFLANQPSVNSVPTFKLFRILNSFKYEILYDFIVSDFTDDYESAFLGHAASVTIEKFPYRMLVSNFSNDSVFVDFVRMLDMFGYCNLLPYFKRAKEVFYSNNLFDSTWRGFVTEFQNFTALQDAIYSVFNSSSDAILKTDFVESDAFNVFGAASYQKMFYQFYRNKYYDLDVRLTLSDFAEDSYSNFSFTYNKLFNFDDFTNGNLSSLEEKMRLLAVFSLHHHAYRKDLFTGVLPSMQFGDVSMQVANLQENGQQMRYFLEAKLANGSGTVDTVRADDQGYLYAANISSEQTSTAVNFNFAPELAISVLESRRADAMQRFKERMLRAGDSTKAIFEAHGWEKPRSEQFHEPIFLGSFDGRLDINTVAATADTENKELGQLAANGVAVVQGSEINFHSSDFGVIIGVMYIVKDSEYNSFGTDRQLCLTEAFDWPYPELQNISLSPVVYRQLNGLSIVTNEAYFADGDLKPKRSNDILGYLPAFMEYKTAIDKVHGEFCSGEYQLTTDHYKSVPRNVGYPVLFSGVFSDWVTPRANILQPDTLSFLYQQKDVVDSVFLLKQTDNQDTDPFLVNAYFQCLAVEPVSVIGLPV